jgi:hypothetical protein
VVVTFDVPPNAPTGPSTNTVVAGSPARGPGGGGGEGPPCEQTATDAVPTVSSVAPSVPVGATVVGTLTLNTTTAISGILRNTAVVGSQALDLFDVGKRRSWKVPCRSAGARAHDHDDHRTGRHDDHRAPRLGWRRLPATGAAIGVLLVLAGCFVLLGGGLRTAAADRFRRRRRR